jgi:pyruvate formate lyase activating enzyme
MAVCNAGAISPAQPGLVDRARCLECFECADACPTQALSRIGRAWSVDDIVREVTRYRPFYDRSNGGVTLSGGEPMQHMEFAAELLAQLRENRIHTLIQTSGLFPLEPFLTRVLPNTNRIHFDIKLVDRASHRRYCGVDNAGILSNFERILEEAERTATECFPSTPLIPGITDTDANILALAQLFSRLGVQMLILHRNNPAWMPKCISLGTTPSDALGPRIGSLYDVHRADEIEQVFLDHGVGVSFQ